MALGKAPVFGVTGYIVGDDDPAFQHRNPGGIVQLGKFEFPILHHLVEPTGLFVPGDIRQGRAKLVGGPVFLIGHLVEKAVFAARGLYQNMQDFFIDLPGVMAGDKQALGLTYRRKEDSGLALIRA
jgi:hypothetical protein